MTSPYQGYYHPPTDHQQSTTVLILGILGIVVCQVLSPIAWVMGTRVVREIDQSGGRLGGRGNANAGRICGMVGTIILILSLLLVVLLVIITLAAPGSFDDDDYDPYGTGRAASVVVTG